MSTPLYPLGHTINFKKSEIFCAKNCGCPHLKNPLFAKCPHWTTPPLPDCGRLLWKAPYQKFLQLKFMYIYFFASKLSEFSRNFSFKFKWKYERKEQRHHLPNFFAIFKNNTLIEAFWINVQLFLFSALIN